MSDAQPRPMAAEHPPSPPPFIPPSAPAPPTQAEFDALTARVAALETSKGKDEAAAAIDERYLANLHRGRNVPG